MVVVNQQCRKEVPFFAVELIQTAYLILLSIYIKFILKSLLGICLLVDSIPLQAKQKQKLQKENKKITNDSYTLLQDTSKS